MHNEMIACYRERDVNSKAVYSCMNWLRKLFAPHAHVSTVLEEIVGEHTAFGATVRVGAIFDIVVK